MIPFSLFKYIFFRGVLYSIMYGTLSMICAFIGIYALLFIPEILHFSKNTNIILIVVATFLFVIFALFYVHKLILNKIIFKQYNRIKIDTSIKSISNKFTIMYILYTVFISVICNTILEILIYKPKDIEQFFHRPESSFKILLLLNIIGIIIYYIIENIFLEKYINVSWKEIPKLEKTNNFK